MPYSIIFKYLSNMHYFFIYFIGTLIFGFKGWRAEPINRLKWIINVLSLTSLWLCFPLVTLSVCSVELKVILDLKLKYQILQQLFGFLILKACTILLELIKVYKNN